MIATSSRPSAQILQFPSGAALALGKGRERTTPVAVAAARPAAIVFGSNWYHDAAILEARDPKKS